MNVVTLIGRLLFAALFIGSGIGHFAKLEAMTGYAKYKKLPAAKLGVL
ncbi:MAG: DoxX family protein, partial [Actinobacteria bacterium]|nr:DoxX family protein [Actinomycetota bacterium]